MTDHITLAVKVTAKAGASSICGWQASANDEQNELVVKVAAPPIDGKANAAVIALLAKSLGLPKSAVAIVRGQNSRHKMLRLSIEAERYSDWVRTIVEL